MTIVLRLFAWLLATAVTFATLGPPGYRPHSSLGQDGEHALAFILIGVTFGLAYPRQRPMVAGTAVGAVGLLELLQLLAPRRHPRLEGFLGDAPAGGRGLVIPT